ncbi:hypothetical protein [Brevundimonas sp. TWP2-3-4b1]|uniref:hypothetical protein n=1 Tax=Brevundimonas sp. TWP2-3-4b1 TaxID=2804580 RepID=UPI003CEA18A2
MAWKVHELHRPSLSGVGSKDVRCIRSRNGTETQAIGLELFWRSHAAMMRGRPGARNGFVPAQIDAGAQPMRLENHSFPSRRRAATKRHIAAATDHDD